MKKTDIKIDKRIESLLSLIANSNVIADIGCDHGFTCIAALLRKKAKKVIAADISNPSLNKARRTAKELELLDSFSFRCGDGLDVLEFGEADTIIISGIGGELMRDILLKGKNKLDISTRLILSPNNRESIVRQWLIANGFLIDNEVLVHENNKFYQIISALTGKPEDYSEIELEFGKHILNRKDENLEKYMMIKIKNCERALDNLKKSDKNDDKKSEFSKKLKFYKEVSSWFQKK